MSATAASISVALASSCRPSSSAWLNALAAHPAAPVSRADLLREVWGTGYDGGSNTVDAVIRSLRKKLGAVADRIETVRGVGYRLR